MHVDTTAPILVHVRHVNPLFGSIERKIDGLDHVVGLIVCCRADQIFFAVLQDAEFWLSFQAKSVHVDITAPILVPVRHANPLIGSTHL